MDDRKLENTRQELASRLVQREVVCCVSSLMSGIMQLSQLVSYRDMQDALGTDSDELSELFVRQDYEEAVRQFIMNDADLDQLEEVAEQHGYWEDVLKESVTEHVEETDEDVDGDTKFFIVERPQIVFDDEDEATQSTLEEALNTIRQCVWELINTDDEFRWVCNEYSLDTDQIEVYEHWVVSDWLARKLAEKGEITGDFAGLTIWGRCCTGQSMALDHVIQEIAAELWPEELAVEKVL